MDANDPSPEVAVTPAPATTIQRALAQLLRPFARIEPDEAEGAVVLSAIVFLLLTAYYLLKTAREPLILLHGGAEVKSYAAAGQAALLVLVVRAYSSVAKRVGRVRLLGVVYLFFASNLVVFAGCNGMKHHQRPWPMTVYTPAPVAPAAPCPPSVPSGVQ